ncbi:MAG: heme exporter protein CcmD [Alphaproteobacteria bacterium]|nr:heme exporter protein CcmD [Alphaproteobacteria bacterium]
MTHQPYIFAAYGLAFILMFFLIAHTFWLHHLTKKKIQQLTNLIHEC